LPKRYIDNACFGAEAAFAASAYARPQESVAGLGRDPARRSPAATGDATMTEATQGSAPTEIDVRKLVPAQRHARIFQLVEALTPGASFVLVNDHDPKPLYYQLEAEHPREFSWVYLQSGPVVWRVEIGKPLKAA
jgi:uncharacterized protein (DUF2249 family)